MRCLDRVVGWAGWVITQTWSLRIEILKVINDSSHGKMPPCHYGTQFLRWGAQPGNTCRAMKEREQEEDSLLLDLNIVSGNKYCFSEAFFSQEWCSFLAHCRLFHASTLFYQKHNYQEGQPAQGSIERGPFPLKMFLGMGNGKPLLLHSWWPAMLSWGDRTHACSHGLWQLI